MTEQKEDQDHLGWVIEKGGVHIGAAKDPERVLITVVGGDGMSKEDARELLTHALVHLGGPSGRADTKVAEVAIELAALAYSAQQEAEKRLAELQDKHALLSRHLGEYMGRLKQYEDK